ncbi:MAG: hypothetical protein JSR46_06765 [Verrucomicrobia bacterium]|nr:hypothetical protein [Verrucomicrobiota bacterium]
MSSIYVHTLGDSTLDNLYWRLYENDMTEAKQSSVEGQLAQKLGSPYEVVSHAYDGFTTTSVLEGDYVGDVLSSRGPKYQYLQEKTGAAGRKKIYPLTELQTSIAEHPDSIHYVVISVGGNDFRVNLRNRIRMLLDIPNVQKRYVEIVEKVQGMGGRNVKPILMFQYRTDANNDHSYEIYTTLKAIGIATVIIQGVLAAATGLSAIGVALDKISPVAGAIFTLLGGLALYASTTFAPLTLVKDLLTEEKGGLTMFDNLLNLFYRPIIKKAEKDNIPRLDLTKTFDPCQNLYTSEIEPNVRGGSLIAEGIDHIIKQHDFTGVSRSYAKLAGSDTYRAAKAQ